MDPRRRPMLPTATDSRTEHEMMMAGELYYGFEKELTAMRDHSRMLCAKLNKLDEVPANHPDRQKILKELIGEGSETAYIESPFRCDYVGTICL
ncbi:hypothetical protein BC829DRAFT_99762 [Chytridium lagenaria]|nr:hypothetical protein BC829DRAFT_99762 [Chytridium lagenaria]